MKTEGCHMSRFVKGYLKKGWQEQCFGEGKGNTRDGSYEERERERESA